jgi:hypothetical protein
MKILWTAGCGDTIALESTWTEDERDALETCYWATRAAGITRPLFEASTRYRHVQHVVLPVDPKNAYFSLDGVRKDFPCLPKDLQDWSVWNRFGEFPARPWSLSTFLTEPPAPLDRWESRLPDRFVLVQHQTTLHTNREQRQLRDLDVEEWGRLIARLEAEDLAAVVVNSPDTDPPPVHPRIVDLVGQTSMVEGLALLRRSQGYWGIASALCVAAAQICAADQLWVKGPELWLKSYRHIYFAPHPIHPVPYLFDHLTQERPCIQARENVQTLVMNIMRPWRGGIVGPGSIIEAKPEEAAKLLATGQAVVYVPRVETESDPEPEPDPEPIELDTADVPRVKRRAIRVKGASS